MCVLGKRSFRSESSLLALLTRVFDTAEGWRLNHLARPLHIGQIVTGQSADDLRKLLSSWQRQP